MRDGKIKILVTGSAGMLGSRVISLFKDRFEVIGYDLSRLDITDPSMVGKIIGETRPDAVINCAAYTRVDDCETHRKEAFSINADGALNLAVACMEHDAKMVQISTDYVFDGTKGAPYLEEDMPNPLSVYARSKWEGEQAVRGRLENHLVVRTSWLYGENGPNFVDTMLRLAGEKDELRVVNDQKGCPTYTADLALAIEALIKADATGTYHVVNGEVCTWYEFAIEILRLRGIATPVVPILTKDFPRPAVRPHYSVMDTGKLLADTGIRMRPWREALKQFLNLTNS